MKILASLLLFPFALFHTQISDYKTFLSIYPISVLLNFIAFNLYFTAIKFSPLSLSLPILSFSPVLLLFTSKLMLKEEPSRLGILGILMVFVGSYILNVSKIKTSLFEPLFTIFKERGSLYVFIVVIIWSITANLDKLGVKSSSPIFWSFSTSLGLGVLGGLILRKKLFFSPHFLYLSLADSLSTIFHMIAVSLLPVSYVISIKRLSVLFSSIWGILILKEKSNFVGIILMTLGSVIIYLWG